MKKIIYSVMVLSLILILGACSDGIYDDSESPLATETETEAKDETSDNEPVDGGSAEAESETGEPAEVETTETEATETETTESETGADESETAESETAAPDTDEFQDYIDVEFVDKDGNPVSISDYEGKFIILNFFTTWCKYCMEEMPDLQSVYDTYQEEGVVILLVNATTSEQGGKETAITWYEESDYNMPMVLDLDGVGSSTYPVQGLPTSYFINKEGKVLGGFPGMLDEATLIQILDTYNQ